MKEIKIKKEINLTEREIYLLEKALSRAARDNSSILCDEMKELLNKIR